MDSLRDRTGAFCGEIQEYDPTSGQIRIVAQHGWSEDAFESAARYSRLNPVAPIALTAALGEPLWAEAMVDFESFRRSTYYRLALEKDGHRDMIHTPLVRNVTRITGWGISRNMVQGPFSPDHVTLARLLSPHIRRALDLSALIDRTAAVATTLGSLLDAMTCAALVVERDGRVVFSNRQAEAELARGRMIRIQHDRVTSPVDSVARLIAAMSKATELRGQEVEVDDPADELVQVSWVRLDRDGGFVLLLRKPEAELTTPLGTAARLFSLTHGETQVLAALLEGRTLDEVAAWLGVSRSTVKTHLDAIFAKTGERRQPDLVLRIMGLKTPFG